MLFMEKETGEIVEILIKSVDSAPVKTAEGHPLFAVGEIVIAGKVDKPEDGIFSGDRFEFLGFLQ